MHYGSRWTGEYATAAAAYTLVWFDLTPKRHFLVNKIYRLQQRITVLRECVTIILALQWTHTNAADTHTRRLCGVEGKSQIASNAAIGTDSAAFNWNCNR